ncbi:putative disease resistance RPP13-like protein 1 [Phalaenopsis equestris]|uniref:putative disease resistance RPP13-like protein 1 n=1 Tax=Phalaenopsis equestris TaxID=78828 RepID=UPI0009E26FAE|nr:putative disease resistance RPP13-like protein 1 [Phalaenopsis equestris]
MADWFVGRVIDRLINACSDYLQDQYFGWPTAMKEELERLRENNPKIQAVVSAYNRAQIRDRNPALNSWLWQLRDAIDEADDVLDDFEYMRLEEQERVLNMEETKAPSSFTRLFLEPARKLRRVCEQALKKDPNLERLEAVVKKLDTVSAQVSTFLDLVENKKQEQQEQQGQQELELQLRKDRETGCLPKNVLIGRGEEKDFVIQWLRRPTNEDPTHIASPTLYKNISLLSIVGHGGVGKTTLLQHIFEDLKEEFELKIWVCVSNDFDAKKIIEDMLEFLNEESPRLESPLAAVQKRLKAVVQSKRFLLVLDDVWEEDISKWEIVLCPLVYGGLGSKILLTTRMDSAAVMISNAIRKKNEKKMALYLLTAVVQSKRFLLVLDDIWEEDMSKWENVLSPLTNGSFGSKILITTRMAAVASTIANVFKKKRETLRKGLEEDVCLKLLNTHAFAGVENLGAYTKLSNIASSIVKKLSGSRLAAKIVGGILNSNLKESFWMNILNSSDVLNIELSFMLLRQPLQNCFAFCGIFPQDHEFDKDDLVRMWIALGFIQESSIEGETLEDIGGRYFDVLVKKSFFDEFQYHEKIYYKMHDLLHDLAESISSEECFRFVGDDVLSLKTPKIIRHLFIKTENLEVLRMIKNVKSLRSLFLTSERRGQYFTEILAEVFEASSRIRLLFIHSTHQKKMPEAIKNLRHLRYLKLTVNLTPRSLSSLYHLRFIIYKKGLSGARLDDFLLGDLSYLSNLRHLELPGDVSIPGIGKLRSLQELNEFNVKNENGYRIGELEHMNDLRKLKVHFLENVKDAVEARNAKLFDKRKLTHLLLNWGKTVVERNSDMKHYTVDERKSDREVGSLRNIVNSDLDVIVLENLKPYKNLKRLSIVSYEGASSAKWMYNAELISNLEYIRLDECSEWETLPPFGKLPHLKSLYLGNMPKAKRLDYNFHVNDNVSVFPSLQVLNMEGLQGLQVLEQVLEDWFDGAAAAAYDCFFPCLTELFFVNCPNLQELPCVPPKLKKMKIKNIGWKAALNCKQGSNNCCGISKSIPLETLQVLSCSNITSLLQADVRLEALRKLSIEDCPNLISLRGDPSLLPTVSIASLEELTIFNNDVQWFPHVCSSLRELSFRGLKSLHVPQLQQLPHIPVSLEEIHLSNLESLQCLPTSLSAISSFKRLELKNIPLLKSLPDLPSSLEFLTVESLDNLECLPSSLSAISSLNRLSFYSIPLLKSLPELPPSLNSLSLYELDSLQCLPSSLLAISSLEQLELYNIPLLKSLPHLPFSLDSLHLSNLDNIECLPSSLSTISSLDSLELMEFNSIPLLKSLPELPPSLNSLSLSGLDNLQCLPSSLSAISSLNSLDLYRIPVPKSLPDLPPSLYSLALYSLDNIECLPSSLSAISSLSRLYLNSIPRLKSLPDLPSSLESLRLYKLHNLECLPSSLSAISSLYRLEIESIPLLKSLPELPSSLESLTLARLDNLQCLPASLSAVSSLWYLELYKIPLLKSLPDLPSSLYSLAISNCHPKLMKRYKKLSGSDWHKIAHIPKVRIDYM